MDKEKGKREGAFPGKRERKARRSFSWKERKESEKELFLEREKGKARM